MAAVGFGVRRRGGEGWLLSSGGFAGAGVSCEKSKRMFASDVGTQVDGTQVDGDCGPHVGAQVNGGCEPGAGKQADGDCGIRTFRDQLCNGSFYRHKNTTLKIARG